MFPGVTIHIWKKLPQTAHGANLSVFGVQLGPQDPPKIDVFRLQDLSYLKMSENAKFCDSSKDGPHFCLPRGLRNRPKMYKNRFSEFAVLMPILRTLEKRLRTRLGGLLRRFFNIK